MSEVTKEEKRCYDCGCCDSTDGWCDLVGDYGFNIDKCTISDEEKREHSSWNIHSNS